MAEFEALKRRRGALKAKLTNFTKYVESLSLTQELNDLHLLQLSSRIVDIEGVILNEFHELQNKIECQSDSSNVEKEYEIRAEFEDKYYEQIAIAKNIIQTNNKDDEKSSIHSVGGASFQNVNVEIPKNVKLPTITLPKFNGLLQNWLEFRDTYESLIHNNEMLSDIQRFHYLRACLEDSAAEIIKSLEFSSSNYVIAWKAVEERYNNKKILVHNHVKNLFNLEPLHRETAENIRDLLDILSKNLRALQGLGEPINEWDTLLIYLVGTKLDTVTSREWETHKTTIDAPSFEVLKTFLKNRAELLETIDQNRAKPQKQDKRDSKRSTKSFIATGDAQNQPKCTVCNSNHYVQNCSDFLNKSTTERFEKVKSLKLCTNCLRPGHYYKVCRRSTCRKCPAKHHTLLHPESQVAKANPVESQSANEAEKANSVSLSARDAFDHVLLSTACITIFDSDKKPCTIRVLLNSGSQSSFISEHTCKQLRLAMKPADLLVNGLNNTASNIKARCDVTISSQYNAYTTELTCFVIPTVSSNLPSATIKIETLSIPKNIKLADPAFFKPQQVDMLIGADLFYSLLCAGQISLGPNKPILQKTKFGWVISGPIGSPSLTSVSCNFSTTRENENIEIQDQLARFWKLEEITFQKSLSLEETACEEHFKANFTRNEDGKFVVALPLKDTVEKLGESYEQAKRRFLSLEKKLEANPKLKNHYHEFIKEYISLDHMEKVKKVSSDCISYYMPHHGVFRENSITTKLRVVFDASAPTSSGYSLNNLQMVGPTIQQDLFSILVRFRQHTFVVSADIAKMYRAVLIKPEQKSLQRILWRFTQEAPLESFNLLTVTYGVSSSAFLATRVLHQLAEENKINLPKISNIIDNDFYVDDMITGGESVEEVAQICKQVSDVLAQGCFELRKFFSNNSEVLKYVPNRESPNKVLEFGENENAKTLGLTWCPKSDCLMYNISQGPLEQNVTKRSILSGISQVFDPLGLVSPCVILIKILLQSLWLERVTWDEPLPTYIHAQWLDFKSQLSELNKVAIKRHAICEAPVRVEIHGFADASERAYGGCIFIRSINENNDKSVNLLCAKTKVAPTKTVTLPRLELCGAITLARLVKKVTDSLRLKVDEITLWTDSTVVLGWLKTPPNKLKPFVSHRVAEIQELTSTMKWRHVPTKSNPADILSRGLQPSLLGNAKLWWYGPEWLAQPKDTWPNSRFDLSNHEELPDLRKTVNTFLLANNVDDFIFRRFSNLTRLKRVVAYMLRFKHNCLRTKENRVVGPLTSKELRNALIQAIKVCQHKVFNKEYQLLKANKSINRNSRILNLNPVLDEQGVLRVGGRLANSKFNFEKRHPIILPAKEPLTKLIITHEHLRLLHAGPQQTLASLREQFWPVSGKGATKGVIRQCVKCYRYRAQHPSPIMGNLPLERLEPQRPFSIVGVDYAGPYMLKTKSGTGFKTSKAYVSLFICFVTKALHLELATDLTKEAFLLALRRFVARRGKPSKIFSDNGTNFVAANTELKSIYKFFKDQGDDLTEACSNEGIEWSFIPPHAPHFGGLWEAGVRSMKHHLKRVLGATVLTYEHFYTLLVQVEAILNSRPISPLSNDPDDLVPLTPSHFLVGQPLTTVAHPDVREIAKNRLSLYQHLQQMQQHLWTRWSKEYVAELQQRCKWKQTQGQLKEGALVLIKDDNQSPMRWKLGRVIRVIPGTDRVNRVAELKTQQGAIKRAFSKICPLPIDVDVQQEGVLCSGVKVKS